MTELDDGQAVTRPISVAELLAKNGTIGSPPVGGGRRRRRRGKSDAVTVAELTGEIPIVRDDGADGGAAALIHDADPGFTSSRPPPGLQPASDPFPRRGRDARTERSHYPRPARHDDGLPLTADASPVVSTSDGGAESMSPDPIDDSMVIFHHFADDAASVMVEDVAQPDDLGIGAATYLRSSDALDASPRTAGDVEPAGVDPPADPVPVDVDAAQEPENADLPEPHHEDYRKQDDEELSRGRLLLRGLTVGVQSVVAAIFGAALFLAFHQLWQWNAVVATVLAILVTLGLVAGVRVIRKTEDITSTLIAVGVGLLVTFGPLALLHANNMI